jgi:hypothetical protein
MAADAEAESELVVAEETAFAASDPINIAGKNR